MQKDSKTLECKDHYIMGAVIGDVIGSVYEWHPVRTRYFDLFNPKCEFTDDTVMTIATMEHLISSSRDDYARPVFGIEAISDRYRKFGRKYPNSGYGGRFRNWLLLNDYKPINSFGNGSGMRISPVGWWAETPEEVIRLAKAFSEVTHNHEEGVKGAVAIALAVYYARKGEKKYTIKEKIEEATGYDLSEMYEHIRERGYRFNETCQGSVPESIISFLAGRDFEDSIINAIYLGGDADTMACMAGAIAEAKFGTESVTKKLRDFVWSKLPEEFKTIIAEFSDMVKEMDDNKTEKENEQHR